MPQVATHLIIADRIQERRQSPDVAAHPAAYRLGAVGPDLTLFLADFVDAGPGRRALEVAVDVLSTVAALQRASAEAEELLDDDLADWLTGGLAGDVAALVHETTQASLTAAALTLGPTAVANVPNPLAGSALPGLNDATMAVAATDLSGLLHKFGAPTTERGPGNKRAYNPNSYDEWWWLDLLHYRRTGPFAQALLDHADTPRRRAYAQGYVTHIAGDVTGHPFVNAVVGGPFRDHVIRHMLVENIIDTWAWDHYHHDDVTLAGLHDRVTFAGADEVFAMVRAAMGEVFADLPTAFGVPSVDQLSRAHRLLIDYLRAATTTGLEPPAPPQTGLSGAVATVLASLEDSAEGIIEAFTEASDWWEVLLAPFVAVMRAMTLFTKLTTLPHALVANLASQDLRMLLFLARQQLYTAASELRWMFCLSGLGKPARADLDRLLAKSLFRIPDHRGKGPVGDAFRYPCPQVPEDPAYWLKDPAQVFEDVRLDNPAAPTQTEASPYRQGAVPSEFIDGVRYDRGANLLRFATASRFREDEPGAPAGDATKALERETAGGPQLGSALDFGQLLLDGRYPLASFDLDGDPGYGGLCWRHDDDNLPTYQL